MSIYLLAIKVGQDLPILVTALVCCEPKILFSDDIQLYKDSRYQVARIVAEAFFDTYIDNEAISSKQKEEFSKFLNKSKSTTVLEILQPKYQHIVDLSYLNGPELR